MSFCWRLYKITVAPICGMPAVPRTIPAMAPLSGGGALAATAQRGPARHTIPANSNATVFGVFFSKIRAASQPDPRRFGLLDRNGPIRSTLGYRKLGRQGERLLPVPIGDLYP